MFLKMFFWAIPLLLAMQPVRADIDSTSEQKSEGNAVLYSLAGTLVPLALAVPFVLQDNPESNANEVLGVGLISVGALIGPGLGHLYVDNGKAFTAGLIVRSLGGGLMLAGIAKSDSLFDKDDSGENLILIGGSVVLISMIVDIAKSDNSARLYNQDRGPSQVSLFPSYQIETGSVGINLALRF